MPSLSIDPVAGSVLSRSNPFPGLRPYEEPDADWFFGRGAEINDLLKRLRRLHFVAIVGASGCGKSSLIRAGVLPHIRDSYLDAEWSIAAFRPGERPLVNLGEALCPELSCDLQVFTDTLYGGSLGLVKAVQSANPPAGSKILVLVDQFEELFQFAQRKGDSAQEEVKQFLKLLLSAAASDEVEVYVVVTMRLEWLNECSTYVGLAEAINEGIYLVPQMSRRQFSQAIMGPLDAAGGAITSALLDRMLNDLDGRSDQLPVLQHALLRIWERRGTKDTFDARDYEAIGTFAKCLSNHAEEVFAELNHQQKAVAEALFRAITQVYKNRKIRRPQPVEEILKTGGDFAQLEAVIAAFSRTGRSFLVTTKGKLEPSSIVDVSHEALIRQWGRLSAWVDNEAEIQSRLARLEADAAEWDRDRKAFKSSLYRGYQLRRAQKDLAPLLDSSSSASRFLRAGQHARLRFLGGIAAAVAAACLLLIGLAVREVHDGNVRHKEELALADKQRQLAQQQAQFAAEQASKAQQFQQNLVQQINAAKGSATALAAIAQNIQAQRVYLQYVRGQPVQQAKTVEGLLQKRGYSVPGIEQVAPDKSPPETQVRYFHPEDQAGADTIASLLKPLVQGGVTTQSLANPNGVVPSGQFEVWLAASPTGQQSAAAASPAPLQAQTVEKKPETQVAPAVVATPAPTIALSPSQNKIQQGQPVTLVWSTDNATDVQIEGVGAVQPSGSMVLTPGQTTTYNLVAKGPGGTATKSALVEVIPAVAAAASVVPANTDPQAIKSALNRYKEAYESESLEDLKQAWPSMSKNDQKTTKTVFDQFNAIRLTLTCNEGDIHIQDDAATVVCTQAAVFTQKGKKQPVPPTTTTFKLRRQGAGWVVDGVQ